MAKRTVKRGTAGGRRPRKAVGTDYDSPWKEALDRYFEPCMALFFPRVHADIDWTRGYEMLDKEFQPVVRDATHGRRYVDKLVKVWLKSGEERWLLIHVEVQASKEVDFPERVDGYNHRIVDASGREVISLVILADDDPAWRPSRYEYARWGFRSLTEFPIVKLLDYASKYRELETHPNPFAVVVLAHLKTLETRRSPADRQAWKTRLVKGLYERGMDSEGVRQLFRFIDWIMELPAPLEEHFWEEIDAYQQEKVMPFIDIAERKATEKGKKEGKKEGMEQGLLAGIETSLKVKFGTESLELMPELRQIQDHVLLGKILKRIETAASPDDLRRVWARRRGSKTVKSE